MIGIRTLVFVAGRLAAAGVFVLSWAYGATALSPFAFDMFVKPRLFPWLESFVTWHHLWFLAAYLVSGATLAPHLATGRAHDRPHVRAAWWAAVAYLVVIGLAAASLILSPRMPLVASGRHDLVLVPGALLPLLWLSVIDHLAGWPRRALADREHETTAQPHIVMACLASATVLWLAHSIREVLLSGAGAVLPWVVGRSWALALDVAAFTGVALLLTLAAAVAAGTKAARAWEYGLIVAVIAVGVAEFFRRVVFPPLLFSGTDGALTAIPLGAAVALLFAGLRLHTGPDRPREDGGLNLLVAFRGRPVVRWLLLVAVPVAAGIATGAAERVDWAMILRRLVALLEATIVFALVLGATRRRQGAACSLHTLVAVPALVVIALHAMPVAARAVVDATGDGRASPERLLDHFRATDALTNLAAAALVAQRETDSGFYRDLVEAEDRFSNLDPKPPGRPFSTLSGTPPPRVPHVFLFVIDSLRRDYLSPYNPAVSFTPAIGRWARDQFVFRNAFTQYGGTWLSIPAIWTGTAVTRRWSTIFQEVNSLEQLIIDAGYDFVVNDFTVAHLLRADAPRTFLDPSIKSVDTDLCQNLSSLQAHIEGRTTTQPLFAYLAPMNVHILNTRSDTTRSGTEYAGFFAPYASRLQRLDGCFGRFVEFLKERRLYDDSVIILTSDHGDSLGDEGRWGHQFYLLPENVRVPLIVQLPADRRTRLTTDLGRLTFLTDITPSLYGVLGYPVGDPSHGFGQPLFVAPGETLSSRRRDGFLIMSSYGSSYGLLRRNGRLLYTVDLVNRQEDAFTLHLGPLGERVPAGDAERRLGQAGILQGLDQVERMFSSR
ncbi:MAG: sulfatase-like hydrolase/transferase [Acidobacteria bacterium]|nr:sulfatase-like hydrolase/transferase [Acidobacteriota bacterium]